jgi:serine/threonine-protein kinase
MSLADARNALTEAGLEPGTVVQRNDQDLAGDTVISASEEAEAEVPPGTVVNLIVASGKVTLTDLAGWTVDAATANLESLGLTATPVEVPDCPATNPPTVSTMSVPPGDVPVHSTVELRYCTGG